MPTFRALRYRLHAFVPDLVDIQRQRFIEFLTEGVVRGLHAINPIKSPRQNVHVVFYLKVEHMKRCCMYLHMFLSVTSQSKILVGFYLLIFH